MDGVWESALANMELYLALREKARPFRADPEVQEALAAAGLPNWLNRPLPMERRTPQLLDRPRTRSKTSTSTRARTKGYGFARIQRLALEHLLGTR